MTTRLLGRYRIDDLLGSGAFATVHLGLDEQFDDPVAIKMLAKNHAVNPDMRGRFMAEGRVLRRISSPAVITVHDLAETDDDLPFMVLELCDRGTLRHRVGQARHQGWTATDGDVVTVAQTLAGAIGALADANVVHRDLTPANVLVTTRGPRPRRTHQSTLIGAEERLVVSDLGFCKDLAASSGISATGGTQGFQPPEQRVLGGPVDVRSDLWAASAVLCWMITGATPTSPANAAKAMTAAGIGAALADAIANALHDDPSRRPPTAPSWLDGIISAAPPTPGDIDQKLGGLGSTGPTQPRTVTSLVPVGMVVVALGLAGIGRVVFGGDDVPPASPPTIAEPGGGVAEDDTAGQGGLGVANALSTSQAGSPPVATPTEVAASDPLDVEFGSRSGGQWAFHMINRDDWEYDVVIKVDAAYGFGKTIGSASPGEALYVTAVDGGYEFSAVPTITDRASPELWGAVNAQFGRDFLPRSGGTDPCLSGSDSGSDDERAGLYCMLPDGLDGASSGASWLSDPEEHVDEFVSIMDGREPVAYYADMGQCAAWLLPDGRIMPDSRPLTNFCDFEGDGVIAEGEPAELESPV